MSITRRDAHLYNQSKAARSDIPESILPFDIRKQTAIRTTGYSTTPHPAHPPRFVIVIHASIPSSKALHYLRNQYSKI